MFYQIFVSPQGKRDAQLLLIYIVYMSFQTTQKLGLREYLENV